ncbi:MAG: SMC-Scp complex subunit ScpB [Ardenticatenaceae bacterium]|nr:SMC-Scp complex subunit ScpB [Ardenticatenaceae bacterium]
MTNQTQSPQNLDLAALIESILFVASGPVPLSRIGNTLEMTPGAVKKQLQTLEEMYASRGIRLQWVDNAVQLTTAPEASEVIERFLGLEVPISRLSPAALEVLSIIAYLQPVTRPQVDEIRGVNSDGALRTLLSKGLLEEVGRLDGPGRPILYGTTPEFMQHFGLTKLDELPELVMTDSSSDGQSVNEPVTNNR